MEGLPALNCSSNCSARGVSVPDPALRERISRDIGLFFMLLLDLGALLGNVAVAFVILKTPKLRKFLFVVQLCIIDALAAITVMPLGIVASSGRVGFGESLCHTYISMEVCFSSASILTISAINIERYYYIVHPMRYEVKMTLGLASSVLLFIWIQASLTSSVPFLGASPPAAGMGTGNASLGNACSLQRNAGSYKRAFLACFVLIYFVLPLVIILTVYCNVFKVARIAALQHGPVPSWAASPRHRANSTGSRTNMMTGSRSHRVSPERAPGGAKAALTLIIIGGQFILCWLPYFAFHLHNAWGNPPSREAERWEDMVRWLAYTSFTVNPFFYGCLNREIRSELSTASKCFLKQSLDEQLGLSSQEGSVEENFLQFLQRTSCVVDRRSSFPAASTPRFLANQSTLSFRIPGQIPEETPELLEQESTGGFRSAHMCAKQEHFLVVAK